MNPIAWLRSLNWKRMMKSGFFDTCVKEQTTSGKMLSVGLMTYAQALSRDMMTGLRMCHMWAEYKDTYDILQPENINHFDTITRSSYESSKGEFLHRVMMLFAAEAGDRVFRYENEECNYHVASTFKLPFIYWKLGNVIIYAHFNPQLFWGCGLGLPSTTIATVNFSISLNGVSYRTELNDVHVAYYVDQAKKEKSIASSVVRYTYSMKDAVALPLLVSDVLNQLVEEAGKIYQQPKKSQTYLDYLRKRETT